MIPDLYDRKLGFGEIFSKGWHIYCRYFSYLIAFVLPCEFVAQMLKLAVLHTHTPRALRGLVSLSTELITLIGTIVVIFVAARAASTLPISWGDCRKKISEAYGRTVWANIVLFVILALLVLPIFAGMFFGRFLIGVPFLALLFALPFVIVGNYLGFVLYAAVLRGQSAVPALCYSWRLVRGRWWYVFGAAILFNLPVVIIGIVEMTAERVLSRYVNWVFEIGFRVFLTSLFQIYSTILLTIFFLNIDRQNDAPNAAMPIIQSENT